MNVPVALVGCGHWGRQLARNLFEMGALAVVCDADPEVRAAAPAGVGAVADLDAVLADPSIRAVVLATPAATHAELGRTVIDAGKDLFVEKPLALHHTDGLDLVAAAEAAGAVLMVGHILEYHPAVGALRELVASGELGELRYLYSNRLNLGRVRTEENILWSFAPHDLSIMIGLAGAEPVRVGSWGGDYLQQGIADVTVTTLEFPGELRGHVFVSWLHPFKEQRLVVVGDRAMAVFADTDDDKLRVFDRGVEILDGVPVARGEAVRSVDVASEEPMRRELEHFLDCVAQRRRPLTDGESGLRVLRVLEASQASLERGGEPVFLAGVGP